MRGESAFKQWLMFSPVVACEPCIVYVIVEGEFAEGEQLEATATYLGGVEGESNCAWYRSKDEEHVMFELIEGTENMMVYMPGYDDINRRLKFKINPVREDGVAGKPGVYTTPIIQMGKCALWGFQGCLSYIRILAEPKFEGARIVGELAERETLQCEGLYFGGEEGPTELKWFRVRREVFHFRR